MLKRICPVAVAALALSAGGAFAEPPIAFTEANAPGVDDSRLEPLTDTDMATVTGRGEACTEHVQALGRDIVVVGLVGLNHVLIATGQVTIGLAPFVCAL